MTFDQEAGRMAVRLVMRHREGAPDYAHTIAREMAKVGRTADSPLWKAAAALAESILSGRRAGGDRTDPAPRRTGRPAAGSRS